MEESYLPKVEKVDVARIVHPQTGEFDFIVEHRDPRTGQMLGKNPYRQYCVGKETVVYERPVGSGHLYWKNGQPAGQYDYELHEKLTKERAKNITEQCVKIGAEHVPWVPEVKGDEKLMRANSSLKAKAEALEKELAAIKAEREAKAAAAPKVEAKAKAAN